MASKISWLLLVMLLSISTFGFSMCCLIVISSASFITGIFIMTFSGKKIRRFDIYKQSLSTVNRYTNDLFPGIPKVVLQMNKTTRLPKADQRLTGSKEIDGPLREIISYIVRDFIQSWYQEVSSDADFIEGFHEICKHLINNFSKSAKDVNWISFFTQQAVEDFTSHLRLFRHAEVSFRRKQRENPGNHPSIETVFFEKESNLEGNICRENVCSDVERETEYLQSICDVLLYLLLPPDDFNNKVLKQFLRAILVSSVLQPLLAQFSDPDVINQNIIYLCKDHIVSSKALLSILRRTDNQEELAAFIQICKHELKVHNAKDTSDKDDVKKYMKSISFVQSISHDRLEKILGRSRSAESDSAEFYLDFDLTDSPILEKQKKLISLPFDVVLNNNIALHYFTQYLVNLDAEGYVFFYHNVEGFRTTVRMMSVENLNVNDEDSSDTEKFRVLALQLYESYLGPNATSKINIDENILKKLMSRLKTESINESCFDEVQEKVYGILENEFYLSGFKDSTLYIKLLAELDLLQDLNSSGDLDSLSSSKSEEEEKFSCDTVAPTDEEMLNELLTVEISPSEYDFPQMSSGPLSDDKKEIGLLLAEVHSTGITHHAGRTFAVYAIAVTHFAVDGSEEKWFVVRRYSEFYDFHEALIQKYPLLSSFNFPAKKPFNNLTRQLMEKRRHMLNEFMQFLLSSEIIAACEGLKLMVYNFLQPNMPEKGKKSFIRSVSTFVSPIKTSVKTVGQFARLVPDTLFELKDGFRKTFFKNNVIEPLINEDIPSISKSTRPDDIPFRIMLLLMDEVFNLRNKDLWFRRRIMTLLRQIIKTMQGGAINRKIKEYVQGMTSTTQIAEWLKLLSQSIWPDGRLGTASPKRDHDTKMRTRIVTKLFLLSAIPDELKHIIGYETSFKGAMLIFNMFQYPALNRRLLLVLLESFLKTLFPNNKIPELLQKLHSKTITPIKSETSSINELAERQSNASCDDPKVSDICVQDTEIKGAKSKDSKKVKSDCSKIPEIRIQDTETTVAKSKDATEVKSRFEPRSKMTLKCLSSKTPNSSPKQRKRKKSMESAVFYTDLSVEDDKVILPLGR